MKKQIKIDILDITYIVVLISFLMGYFELIYLGLLTIIIHELGHAIMAYYYNNKNITITIYPFGGLTNYNSFKNSSMKEDFLILISGPLIQILFLLFVIFLYNMSFVNNNTYKLFIDINKFLLFFNLIPIIPLDGGKLLNIILRTFFSVETSSKISIVISLFTFLLICSYIFLFKISIYFVIVLFLISKDLILEIKKIGLQ